MLRGNTVRYLNEGITTFFLDKECTYDELLTEIFSILPFTHQIGKERLRILYKDTSLPSNETEGKYITLRDDLRAIAGAFRCTE